MGTRSQEHGWTLEYMACLLCGSNQYQTIAAGQDYAYETTDSTFQFVSCQVCGHVYLNPRPISMCASLMYPAHYYTRTDKPHHFVSRMFARLKDYLLLARIADLLAAVPVGGRILEAGCGDGSLLLAIRRRRKDLHLSGLDLTFAPGQLKHLQENNIECIESLIEDVHLEAQYDLIIMNQILEHLWDTHAALHKMYSALSPGGVLSIATPNLDGYDYPWFRAGVWGGYYFPRHLHLYSGASLDRLMLSHGFRVVAHRNLVAPLIWMLTVKGLLLRKGWMGHRLFRETNVMLAGVFFVLDLCVKQCGVPTSNQHGIYTKPVSSP